MRPEILFVLPPYINKSSVVFEQYLGTAYIQAYLQKSGIYTESFVRKQSGTISEIIDDILSRNAKRIGFTCYDTNYYYVKILAQTVKERKPETMILVGGPTATASDELLLEDCPAIDVCFRGEAEESVRHFIVAGESKQHSIPGISYRKGGSVVRTPLSELVTSGIKGAELDIFPSPYLSGIIEPDGMDMDTLITFRGCPYHCSYCHFPTISTRTIRMHSIERVLQEADCIQKMRQKKGEKGQSPKNTPMVLIADNYFNVSLSRAKDICLGLINGGCELPFLTEMRADPVDEQLLQLMKKAGFSSINFGLESADPEILKTICKARQPNSKNRGLNPEINFLKSVKKSVEMARQTGIETTVSIIHGLPGETPALARKTHEFIQELGVTYIHNTLQVLHGTIMYEMCNSYGIKVRPSETVFPLVTEHAFDISQVELSHNSYKKTGDKLEAIETIMKIWGVNEDSSDGINPSVVVLPSISNWSDDDLEWLKENIEICTLMATWKDCSDKLNGTQDFLSDIASWNIPSQNIFFLEIDSKSVCHFNSKQNIKLVPRGILRPSLRKISPIVKSVEFHRIPDLEPSEIPGEQIVTQINEETKSETLKMLRNASVQEIMAMLINKKVIVADSCRWCSNRCPAISFRRWIVNSKKEIQPCFSGPCVAHIGDNLSDIRKKLDEAAEEVKASRGCNECPVSEHCAKCLYPYPFTPEEYCELQREGNVRTGFENAQELVKLFWYGTRKAL